MKLNPGLILLMVATMGLGGCQFGSDPPPSPIVLRDCAVRVVGGLLSSPVVPVTDSAMTPEARAQAEMAQYQLRALALETAARFPQIVQTNWLQQGLDSKHDGVCYAALLAVGQLARHDNGRLSRPFTARVRQLLDERVLDSAGQLAARNPFIRLAAGYAYYRLSGDADSIAFMPDYLAGRVVLPPLPPSPGENRPRQLSGEDREKMLAKLRYETAYVLSLMPELHPQPLIAPALKDPSPMVRAMAQTRLAVLGDKDALNVTLNMVRSPVADEACDAILALEEIQIADLDTLRVCLERTVRPGGWMRMPSETWLISLRPEVRMAAARTLGLKGDQQGQPWAMRWLNFSQDRDVPEEERLPSYEMAKDELHEHRVRFLAALALGAIGDYEQSAGPLLEIIQSSPSVRFRLTAARAALELLQRSGREGA